jgi:hypothetical protein
VVADRGVYRRIPLNTGPAGEASLGRPQIATAMKNIK